MKVNFSFDITTEHIDQAIKDFENDYDIEDLDRAIALECILFRVLNCDNQIFVNDMIDLLSKEEQDALVEEFGIRYGNRVQEHIKESLTS